MVRVSKSFVDKTLWPEYLELSEQLRAYLHDITQKVIREAIFEDNSEAVERAEPAAIEDQRGKR